MIFAHLFFVYIPLVKFIGKKNIKEFLNGIKEIVLFAFSTSSSSATIPITLHNLRKNFMIKPKISSFTVPLGATINMDGTAIMQGMATIFIANIYNIDLLSDYLSIIITATLASVGTAGVQIVGIIMLGMVLNQVGLPLEGIAIVVGVDRLLDMLRTSLNVTGDAMVTIIVNKTEKQWFFLVELEVIFLEKKEYVEANSKDEADNNDSKGFEKTSMSQRKYISSFL